MKPETKPSLSARIVAVQHDLSRILDSFWVWIVSLFSKLLAPLHKLKDLVRPQNNPNKEKTDTPKTTSVISNVVPSQPSNDQPYKCRYEKNQWWKTAAEMAGIAAVIVYTIFSGFQMKYSRQQRDAANTSATAATQTLNKMQEQFVLDQRPHVAIDRFQFDGFAGINKKHIPPTIGKPIVVNIFFKNVGKTPAINIKTHQHLLFAQQLMQFRIEPQDSETGTGSAIETQEEIHVTAMSVKNTFDVESAHISPDQIVNWDGTDIFVFGRITYYDSFSNLYCTPFLATQLNGGATAKIGDLKFDSFDMGKISHHKYSVSDLCAGMKY